MSPELEPFKNFKEYFAFVTYPSGMWGLQVYGQNSPGNIAIIKDGDIVDVPIGPHAVVAAPGTRLGYIWIYTGAWSKEL
jgi:5-deoxy-D-glucuronate isomerase